MKRVLFLCSQNRLRCPTAEQACAPWEGIEVASAGLNRDPENVVTPEWRDWAELIFVMAKVHRDKLGKRFRARRIGERVVCLDNPEGYDFMSPERMALFKARVAMHLPRV